jgi:tetratricopeptide (TPR) repeat protein
MVLLRQPIAVQLIAALLVTGACGAWAQSGGDLDGMVRQAEQLRDQGRYAEAIPIAEQALELAGRMHGKKNPKTGEAVLDLGWLYDAQGRALGQKGHLAQAEEMFTKALALYEAADNKEGEAAAHNGLGFVYAKRADLARAGESYAKALKLHEEAGNKRGAFADYSQLGHVCRMRGDLTCTEDKWRKAEVLAGELGDNESIALSSSNLGILYYKKRDKLQACVYWRKSRRLWRQAGNWKAVAGNEEAMRAASCLFTP